MDEHEALLTTAAAALRLVFDPELGVNVVDLGLVNGLEESQGLMTLRYQFTSPGCPVGGMIADGMHEALAALPGVSDVVMDYVEDPPWSVGRATPEGRRQLGL